MNEKKFLNWPGLQYLYYVKMYPYFKRVLTYEEPIVPPVPPVVHQPVNEIWYTSSDNQPIADFGITGAFGEGVVLLSNEYDGQKFIAKYDNPVTGFYNYALSMNATITSISIPSMVSTMYYALLGCPNIESIKVDSDNEYYDSRNNCNAIIESSTNKLLVGCGGTVIPSTVTELDEYAFCYSNTLTSISIPSSVTSIGQFCFVGCSTLTNADLSNSSITILPSDCFASCNNLTTLTLNNGLKTISRDAIALTNIEKIVIPNTVTLIKENAFRNTYLTEFTTVDGGTESMTIESNAFRNITTLKSIYISDYVSVIEFPNFMVSNTSASTLYNNIESISVSPNNNVYDSRGNCNALIETSTNTMLLACKNTSDIGTMVPSINIIGESACSNISEIQYLTIPSSVTEIKNSAFNNCTGLTTLNISGSTETIGSGAFAVCSSLNSVTLNEGIKTIGSYVFSSCDELTNITIPESVTNMNNGVFYGCKNLWGAKLPSSMTVIPEQTFQGCSSLKNPRISNNVTEIGPYAFAYCGMTNYNLSSYSSLTIIGHHAFAGSSLVTIDLPSSITSIGSNAFYYSSSLYKIICRATTPPTIGSNVFDGLRSTYSVQVPSAYVNTYKSAPGWSNISSHITDIP